jgi:uncharacterized protein (TIGR03083 family)
VATVSRSRLESGRWQESSAIRYTIKVMTSNPYGMFTPTEYQGIIRRESEDLLAALATADPAAPVPACPEWTVRDLVDHLGRIHQWARLNACSGLDSTSPKHPTSGAAESEELASWYAGCVDELLKTLSTTDPAEPCWTFQPGNKVARFWSRRQSHELAMHRNDLQAAVGLGYRYEPAHAVDGIAEVLDVFLKRRKVYGVPPLDVPVPLLIECTDRPDRWLVAPVPGQPADHEAAGPVLPDAAAGTAAATIRGPAAGLLLAMWKRQDVAAAGLTIDGDAGPAEGFLTATLTP